MTPASRRPTSADVAERAGVSRATVSMVLNGRTEGTVAEATRRKVLAAADELGYARSALALSLKQRRTRTIGMITDEIATSPWAGRMVRAASQAAARRDHMVLTVDLSLRGSSVDDAVRMLAERQVDGLIYATMGRTEVELPQRPLAVPMVLLNCVGPRGAAPVPAVVPDDRDGARRAARRLLLSGHERVAMIGGDGLSIAEIEREAGFREELEAAGARAAVVTAGWQMDDGVRAMQELLEGEHPPTGVFCIRDRVAAGVIHAAALAGVDVPGELSVIGFDDEDYFAGHLTPPLTSVALPHAAMGERAMDALLDLVDAGVQEVRRGAEPEVVACPLVERETVAPPRR